ncbi:MAG: FAD-dependent oxidoreductase [Firmicutes bacterium]|jgi:glycerol-3-phosphate dehydrogenase|nr:FAD-dependent oxidoreductase [Bacillota bacterium]
MQPRKPSIVVVGGGVTGAAIARELTRYRVSVTVVEREDDLARGASGACGGVIHSGFDPAPGTLKASLNVIGNSLYPKLADELGFAYRRTGTLILAFDPDGVTRLEEIRGRAARNGVELETWTRDRVIALEPNANPGVLQAVFAPSAGAVFPPEVVLALARSAALNGARFELETEVTGIAVNRGAVAGVETTRGFIPADIVVNAAGVDAAAVAAAAGDHTFSVRPRKGQQVILDKRYGSIVARHIMTLPTRMGKGIGVAPTVGGNIHLGSTAEDGVEPHDVTTTSAGLDWIFENAKKLVPCIERDWMIASFAGVRAISDTDDFIVRESPAVERLFNVAGIQSPGLSAAPAIASHLVGVMVKAGVPLEPEPGFRAFLDPPIVTSRMSTSEWARLVAGDPSFGRIVCRCEGVTEGEIVRAIEGPLGARSIEGVKRRTRAGMGRCQGGFCGPRVAAILSRRLGVPLWKVRRRGAGSELGVGPAKCCLRGGVGAR